MIGLIGLITAVLCWFLLYQKPKTNDQVLLAYKRFCKKLAKQGLLRTTGEGAKDFAERIKIKLPDQAKNIDQITTLFIKLRYERSATPEDLQQLKILVRLFRPVGCAPHTIINP
jgi:hypothetical protein